MPKSLLTQEFQISNRVRSQSAALYPFDTFSLDLDTSALIRGWWIIDLAIDVAFVDNCDFQPGGFWVFWYFKVYQKFIFNDRSE